MINVPLSETTARVGYSSVINVPLSETTARVGYSSVINVPLSETTTRVGYSSVINVPLSETTARVGYSSVIYYYWNMYVYFLCGLVCICIHESDAELIVCVFFSDVLTYRVMLQDFSCYSYVMCL